MIITKPRTIYASVLLLNERKNLGPAISPTAVTKSAVPILDTIPKLLFILVFLFSFHVAYAVSKSKILLYNVFR